MGRPSTTFNGKTKLEIALEAFKKYGLDATREQIDIHFVSYGIAEGCEPSMYWNGKRQAKGQPSYNAKRNGVHKKEVLTVPATPTAPTEQEVTTWIGQCIELHPGYSDDQILYWLAEVKKVRNVKAYRKIVEDQRRKIMATQIQPAPRTEKEKPDVLEQIKIAHALCSGTPGGIPTVRAVVSAIRTMGIRDFDNALNTLEAVQLTGNSNGVTPT